jgi:hypothetical protein
MQSASELEQWLIAPGVHGKVRYRDDKAHVVPLIGLVSIDPIKAGRKRTFGLSIADNL